MTASVQSNTITGSSPLNITSGYIQPSGLGVLGKLITARTELQTIPIQKSGHNKFAGYSYFELGDFLPAIQNLFAKHGLVDVIAFTAETATLTLYDISDGSSLKFTSPMADAQLKGCHPIQNLGAVETYQRRYLYVTCMAIVEHDALESVTGSSQGTPTPTTFDVAKTKSSSVVDNVLFVQGLVELGESSTSLDELTNLWKTNQTQIDALKSSDKNSFSQLQKKFAELKSKF
jgi:hypothetical protein